MSVLRVYPAEEDSEPSQPAGKNNSRGKLSAIPRVKAEPDPDQMADGRGRSEAEPILDERYVREVFASYLGLPESKRLLDQIIVAQHKKQFKTLSILSYLPGEGRSFVSLVIATGYALLLSRKVLLVDAVQETRGRVLLTEKILRQSSERALDDGRPRIGALDLLSTRSTDPSRVESTDFYLPTFVDRARDDYDLIIYDTCSIRSASAGNMDPVIIARGSDASLIVTSPKSSTNRSALLHLRNDLARWELPVIGTIFNRCPGC